MLVDVMPEEVEFSLAELSFFWVDDQSSRSTLTYTGESFLSSATVPRWCGSSKTDPTGWGWDLPVEYYSCSNMTLKFIIPVDPQTVMDTLSRTALTESDGSGIAVTNGRCRGER